MFKKMADDKCCLEKLKSMREKVNWEFEDERREFLRQLYPLIKDWKGQLPNIRDFFDNDEMDWLLTEDVINNGERCVKKLSFVKFVISAGYRDEPELGEDGEPLLLRRTAVHRVNKLDETYVIHRESITLLFKIYARWDVNYINEYGETHFYVACKFACDEVVEAFLELGRVDPNLIVPQTGNSPLHLAVGGLFHASVMIELLRNGADPNLPNKAGETPLHIICSHDYDILSHSLRLFLICNDSANQTVHIDAVNINGCTPLHYALSHNKNTNIVESLLRRGANPNLASREGLTALHYVHDIENAEMLFRIADELDQPLLVNAGDKDGFRPLHHAVLIRNKEVAKLLLRKGAKPNLANKYGVTPLHMIWDDDFTETFLTINEDLNLQVEINAQDIHGSTPLHWALCHKQPRVVRSLLKRGANPNLACRKGFTALHFVDHIENVKMLFRIADELDQPLLVNASDKDGFTPLHHAVFIRNEEVARLLLENGAKPNLANKNGLTPLHMICSTRCDDNFVGTFLTINEDLNLQVEIDAQDIHGFTPLHYARYHKQPRGVESLLKRGAGQKVC